LPGMYAETVLQLAERRNVLVVPLEAVTQSEGDATALAVTAQNTVQQRHVKLGLQGKTRVEVLSGLSENERVIVGNHSQFRDGQRVSPKEVKLPSSEIGGAS